MTNPTRNQRRNDLPVIVISLATAFAWGSLFSLPERTGIAIVCGLLFMVGLWSVLFPSRLIEWAAPVRAEIDAADERLWWIPRLIGVGFMILSVLTIIGSF